MKEYPRPERQSDCDKERLNALMHDGPCQPTGELVTTMERRP